MILRTFYALPSATGKLVLSPRQLSPYSYSAISSILELRARAPRAQAKPLPGQAYRNLTALRGTHNLTGTPVRPSHLTLFLLLLLFIAALRPFFRRCSSFLVNSIFTSPFHHFHLLHRLSFTHIQLNFIASCQTVAFVDSPL